VGVWGGRWLEEGTAGCWIGWRVGDWGVEN